MEITLRVTAGELTFTGQSAGAIRITEEQPSGVTVTGDSAASRVVQIRPWSPEEAEHYSRTGQTPLERLHRANLVEMWATGSNGPSADHVIGE